MYKQMEQNAHLVYGALHILRSLFTLYCVFIPGCHNTLFYAWISDTSPYIFFLTDC